MANPIRVDTGGLSASALSCRRQATDVAASSAPDAVIGEGFPATAAAVRAAYASVSVAAQRISERLESTATIMAGVATVHTNTGLDGAARIAAVAV